MTDNPYSPPQASITPPESAPESGDLAGLGQRFGNLLLDYFGMLIFGLFFGVFAGFLLPELLQLNQFVLGLILFSLYYLPSETMTGRTPAKFLTGTRVVTEDGGPPSLMHIVKRTATRLVPFEVFSFLGGDLKPVGWHDSWSGTRVIRTRGPK